MKKVSREAQRVLELLVEGLDEDGAAKKIDNAPGSFMAVSVSRLLTTALGPIFSVAHYFQQNGDAVPDPDVEMLRARTDGTFYPIAYRDVHGRRVAAEIGEDGNIRADLKYQRDLASFITTWCRNIRTQQQLGRGGSR